MATLVGSSLGDFDPPPMAYDQDQPLFTCLSCSIAFPNPEDQRTHYRSDLHRYNMKRRVANLPPVKAEVLNAKILERRATTSQQAQAKEGKCGACNKTFATPNASKDHLNSKKHKEKAEKLNRKSAPTTTAITPSTNTSKDIPLVFHVPNPLAASDLKDDALPKTESSTSNQEAQAPASSTLPDPEQVRTEKKTNAKKALMVDENATEEEVQAAIDAKVASSRRIDPAKECLFCPTNNFTSLTESLAHMAKVHSFFIPDSEYLVDLPGFVSYLADKISIGNLCLYCNGRGKGFHDMASVRKHMLDKYHCKIAYEGEEDQLELSDFYDFTSSYPTAEQEQDEWEDDEDDDDDSSDNAMDTSGDDANKDEIIDLTKKQQKSSAANQAEGGIRSGDSEFEIVLPSGARLGHRSLRRYYEQALWQTPASQAQEEMETRSQGGGAALARRLIAESGMGHDDQSGLVVQGRGGQLVKARNRGEAKEAKRHLKEFRDVAKREAYRTRVAYTNNNQKHFRDPFLQ